MRKPTPFDFENCPTGNICELTQPDAAECGTLFSHQSPLIIAEQLCPRALRRVYADQQKSKKDSPIAETQYNWQMAWSSIEVALGTKDDAEATDLFDDAELYAKRSLEADILTMPYYVDSTILLAYLPTFIARRQRKPPKGGVMPALIELHDEVTNSEVHTQKSHPDHLYANGHQPCFGTNTIKNLTKQKVSFLMFCERSEIPVYPTSARESAVFTIRSALGHDAIVLHGDKKVPIVGSNLLQRSNQKESTIQWRLPLVIDNTYSPKDQADSIGDLLSREANGQISADEESYLNTLALAVKAQIKEYTETYLA